MAQTIKTHYIWIYVTIMAPRIATACPAWSFHKICWTYNLKYHKNSFIICPVVIVDNKIVQCQFLFGLCDFCRNSFSHMSYSSKWPCITVEWFVTGCNSEPLIKKKNGKKILLLEKYIFCNTYWIRCDSFNVRYFLHLVLILVPDTCLRNGNSVLSFSTKTSHN